MSIFKFYFIFNFLTFEKRDASREDEGCKEVAPLRLKGPNFTSNHSKYLTCLSEANYCIIASFCTMHSRDVTG